MKPGAFVIPGAEIFFVQQETSRVFRKEDTEHIYSSAEKERKFSDQEAYGFQKYGHSVDKKHKDGSITDACLFTAAEGLQSGKQYFQAPSKGAAVYKSS